MQAAVRQLRLEDKPLCVHSSLRSFGGVDGGAKAVIDGLLAEGSTVLVPSFSSYFAIAPPEGMRPERNAWDYSVCWALPRSTRLRYTPSAGLIDSDMGALPVSMVSNPARSRGNHPLNSFMALGPTAEELVQHQSPLDVYAPLSELAERGGYVVLMGVGLERMTALHLAEQNAGRTLFRRWADDLKGKPMMVAIGSCSNGFPNLDDVLAPLERRVIVGESLWRVFPLRDVLKVAEQTMRDDPEITRCDDRDCERCNDAIAGGPILA
ncbi:MAG: AAC(3) family N-acetyltransferase [Chloroflexia bacterium]|nr:AAC(3) family N-acetyltransferase [Chloroflexia bacterium]